MDKREEFKKYERLPLYGNLLLFIGVAVGLFLYMKHTPLHLVFVPTLIGLSGELVIAYFYRCPNCHHYLWNVKNRDTLRHCPQCNARLRD